LRIADDKTGPVDRWDEPPLTLPSLDNLRCFEAAAQSTSFRAAARKMALTPAAFGQRIRQLESQLSAQLFARTTRSVSLTAAGLALLPAARSALEAAATCVRTAQGGGALALELTMGTRPELGQSFLLPNDEVVTRACPGVTLHYYFGSGPELLSRVRLRELDCAVTSARFTDPSLEALPLHREDYVFVGATSLLERVPLTRQAQAGKHTLLDVDASLPLFRYWLDASKGTRLRFGRVWRVGGTGAMCSLVLEGRGVAVLPLYMVRDHVDAGVLQNIFPSVKPESDYFRLVFSAQDPRRATFERMAATLLALPLR
jgi:LysR family transcriptional regulator, glycine cleavage system transcriptional activator